MSDVLGPGSRVGGYVIQHMLGAGFRRVFRAQPVDGGGEVAVKIAPALGVTERLVNEIRLLARAARPH